MCGADVYRGGEGPVDTGNGNNMKNPLYTAFIAAGEEAGYGRTEGLQRLPAGGFRPHAYDCAAWRALLYRLGLSRRPLAKRPNLTVVTEAEVDKLVLSEKQITGVRYQRRGEMREVSARREVILSAGSIGSPAILQRSGIGPSQVLAEAGCRGAA
jgi:choline dehydrogenase